MDTVQCIIRPYVFISLILPRENGCLQIIPRSHHLGRLSHARSGDLASVDPERLEAIIKVLGEPVMVETRPGDVLFFHR